MLDLLLPLLRNTSLLAVVALAYGLSMSHLPRTLAPGVLGVLCAFGALASMLDPIEMREGVYVDSRTTMVMLASFFAGPVGALLAGGTAAAYRIHLGGAGMVAGVTVIAIGAMIGLAGYSLFVRRGKQVRSKHVVALALLAPVCSLGVFVLPYPLSVEVLGETLVPLNVTRASGVLLLGLMILHEDWRIHAETEVRRLAFVDELSGLANRRAFYAELNDAWERWERYKIPFSVVMVDIDRFKGINDAYGHPTGDEVIRCLAECMNTECRTTDVAARVGGEEFAVLLVHTKSAEAVRFAERIRQCVEDRTIPISGTDTAALHADPAPLQFTVSLGVNRGLGQAASRQDVLSSADQALYMAKRGGRNRVVLDGTAGPAHCAPAPLREPTAQVG